MVEDVGGRSTLEFASRGLLIQDADGTVYFFKNAVLDLCRESNLTRKQKAQTKKFFDELRKKKRLVDAAFLPTFHVFEGTG
jgi:hypothetical protein